MDILKALGHPVRLQIAILLYKANREISVGELKRATKAKQSLASQQLTIMKHNGVIKGRREGNVVYYELINGLRDLMKTVVELNEGL